MGSRVPGQRYTPEQMDGLVGNYADGENTFGLSDQPSATQLDPDMLQELSKAGYGMTPPPAPAPDADKPFLPGPDGVPQKNPWYQNISNIQYGQPLPDFTDASGVGGAEVGVPFPNTNENPNISLEDGQPISQGSPPTGAVTQGDVRALPSPDGSQLPFDTSALSPRERAMAAYLSEIHKGYSDAASGGNDAVAKATDYRNMMSNVGNFGSAIDRIVTARSKSFGGPGANDQAWQQLSQQGQMPLQMALSERQRNIQNYMQQQALKGQAINQYGEMQQRQLQMMQAKRAMDAQDPNSEVSKGAFRAYQAADPGSLTGIKEGQLSADNLKAIAIPGIKNKNEMALKTATLNQTGELKKAQLLLDSEWKKYQMNRSGNPQAPAPGEQAKPSGSPGFQTVMTRDSYASPVATEQKHNDEVVDKVQKGGRGLPDIQQARSDRYATKKAMEIVEKYGVGDPNRVLDASMYYLFNEELSKLAKGGVPTDAGEAGINEETWKKSIAKLQQKAENKPINISAGEFVKNKASYIRGIDDIAREHLKGYAETQLGLLGGGLTQTHYDNIKQNFIDKNFLPTAAPKPAKGDGGTDGANAMPKNSVLPEYKAGDTRSAPDKSGVLRTWERQKSGKWEIKK